MIKKLKTWAGWLPTIILPWAATEQLVEIAKAQDVEAVSLRAWLLFLTANIGSLVFAPRDQPIARFQVIVAFGLTALVEIAIIILLLLKR
ncbi:MAG: hypothetical protein MK135_17725 [Polyangiaceae bacterium]|nr:hypothetical protein [Polyangiaceae bacterium]